MRRRLLLCGLGAVVAVLGLGLSVRPPDAGVQVTIQNQGPGPLHEVVVHVTGDSYQVGDIGIGESRTVAVQSHGESHVEIESALEDGRRSRQAVDCYFESNHYRGVIAVDFENGTIQRIDNRVVSSIW
jgi:hypothetical protein